MTWLSHILSKSVRGAAMAVSLRLQTLTLAGCGAGRLGFSSCVVAAARTVGTYAFAGAFGDARSLAGTAPQIIQLRSPNHAAPHHLDRRDPGRKERKDTLDALAVRNLAQREIGVHARIFAADAHPFEDLDALAFALDDLDADPERVPRIELRDWPVGGELFDLLLLELLK